MEAKIYNFSGWVKNTNPENLQETYDNVLKESGFTVLNFQEHHFSPMGWTGLWLLSESHFAIHTFPEEEKSYIELSSCTESYFENFKNLIKEFLYEN